MTPHVISVSPDETVADAARLMLQKKISGLPVVDDRGNLVGIVTEGDFLRRTEIGTKRQRLRWVEFFIGPGQLADEYIRFSGRKVRDVMTNDVHARMPETPLSDVVRLMERHRIKRLPVIDNGKPVGIVTRANLLHAMASFAHDNGRCNPSRVASAENPLQCAPMHVEAARGLRHVAPAGLMNLLDMLQAHIGW
jgi:CBS domain-containing protein